jgi:hypothetical protein
MQFGSVFFKIHCCQRANTKEYFNLLEFAALACHFQIHNSNAVIYYINIGCSFKFFLKVVVEESTVNAPRIADQSDHGSAV